MDWDEGEVVEVEHGREAGRAGEVMVVVGKQARTRRGNGV
jgi:hypothetical protein